MKTLLTPGTLASMLLLGLAGPAGAQSLGMAQADALIGRPLELSVPARFASNDAGDQCVHADVSYGDTRLPPRLVRTTVVGAGEQRRVHVETLAPIDEPVVTVAVRAGCTSTVSRSYTLLPEPAPRQVVAAAAARSVQPGGILTTALPIQTAGSAAVAARAPAVRTGTTSTREAPARPRAVRAPRVQEAPGAPRLRVEVFEPENQQTLLRVSAAIADPIGDAARRATAALLWQALNASPSELLRTSALVQKLEGELAQLQQASAQTHSEVLALRRELQSPPVSAGSRLTQLLALLVLLAGGTSAFLWFRNRRGADHGPWGGAPLDAGAPMRDSQPPQRQQQPQPVQRAAPARFAPASRHADVATQPIAPDERADPSPSGFPTLEAQPEAPAREVPPLDFDLPEAAPPAPVARAEAATMMRVETLAATFEEVEFLTSLGLWNDAMDILKTYLESSTAPAPLAFLELMRLYMKVDDAAGVVSVRRRYQQVFGVEAPSYDQITAPVGVEGFPDLAMRITRAWRTPQVLDHIEQYLYAAPAPEKAFSLQAGRDLLYLYDLALALLIDSPGHAPVDDAEGHALAPWAMAESPAQARMAAEAAAEVSGGHHFALDLDLGAQVEELPESRPDLMDAVPARQLESELKPEPAPQSFDDAFSAAVARESQRPAGRL